MLTSQVLGTTQEGRRTWLDVISPWIVNWGKSWLQINLDKVQGAPPFPDNAVPSCNLWETCRTSGRRNIYQVSCLKSEPNCYQSLVWLCTVVRDFLSGLSVMPELRWYWCPIGHHSWDFGNLFPEEWMIDRVHSLKYASVYGLYRQVPATTQNVINGVWEESSTDRWL